MRVKAAGMIVVLGICLGLWALILSYVSVLLNTSVLRPFIQVLSVLVCICFVIEISIACMRGERDEAEEVNKSNSR